MADRAVRFDFLGRDVSASRTADRVARHYDGLGAKLRTFGKVTALALGGAVAGGVALLGHAMVQGAKDAQAYQALGLKTAAVIKSTGNQAHISVKGIQALAAKLETLSGVDETLIINSQNVLATFTRVRNEVGKGNDIFDQATKAALNMSAALGTDLQASTIQLGKALNDPVKGITALQRVGVSFTAQQKDQIKTLVESGRTLDAQKLILKELETEFGGAAKAAGSGLGGALARLQDAWGDMWRGIMGKALPGLTNLTNWIARTGVPKFSEFISFLQGLVPKVVDAARKWGGGIVGGLQDAIRAGDWSGLGKQIADVLGRLGGDLVSGLRNLIGKVDWVNVGKELGRTAFPFVVGFTATLFDGLITAARQHPFDTALFAVSILGLGKLGGVISSILSKIPILRWFAPLFSKLNELTAPLNNAMGKLASLFSRGFSEGFARHFPTASKLVKGAFETLIVSVYAKVDDAIKAGARFVEGLGRGVGSGVGRVLAAAGRVAAALVRAFAGAGSWLFAAGRNLISGLISGILSKLGDLAGVLSRAASTVKSFWPFSPARQGPLSGSGDLRYAGQNIAARLAMGMNEKTSLLGDASGRLAGGVALAGAGTGGLALAGGGGALRLDITIPVTLDGRQVGEASRQHIIQLDSHMGGPGRSLGIKVR